MAIPLSGWEVCILFSLLPEKRQEGEKKGLDGLFAFLALAFRMIDVFW
jgi:hypothetical protein